MAYYADTSALVKLIVDEPESADLHRWIIDLGHRDGVLVTSDLTRTELGRAVRRALPDRAVRVREVLDALVVLTLDSATFDAAARLDPPELRSLDAVHLGAALALGDDLEGFLTYDARLADTARRHGIPVIAPGA